MSGATSSALRDGFAAVSLENAALRVDGRARARRPRDRARRPGGRIETSSGTTRGRPLRARRTAPTSTTGGRAAGTRSSRPATGPTLHGRAAPVHGRAVVGALVGRDRARRRRRLGHDRRPSRRWRRPGSSVASGSGPTSRSSAPATGSSTSTCARCRCCGGSTLSSRSRPPIGSTTAPGRCWSECSSDPSMGTPGETYRWPELPDPSAPGGTRDVGSGPSARGRRLRRPLGDRPPRGLARPDRPGRPARRRDRLPARRVPARLAVAGLRRLARPSPPRARTVDEPPDAARGGRRRRAGPRLEPGATLEAEVAFVLYAGLDAVRTVGRGPGGFEVS